MGDMMWTSIEDWLLMGKGQRSGQCGECDR
jgi:hypothetical protein